jgi:hypothetical protein
MIHKASSLIAEAFDSHKIKYRVSEAGDASIVEAGFSINAGPQAVARFISKGEENDVAVRVFSLICKVPAEKRTAVMEACNLLSGKIRFFKFYLNSDNDVNVEADLPLRTGDACVGECCFELFVRLMQVLNAEYHILAEALYSGANSREKKPDELLRLLNELRNKPITTKDEEKD